MARQALIVIDIQNDYFADGKWPLIGVDAAADNAARLIQAFRQNAEPVVHIRHEFLARKAGDYPSQSVTSLNSFLAETLFPGIMILLRLSLRIL